MNGDGRIGRFVAAARGLLRMQLAAALLALVLAVWALLSVWGLAAERDRLQAQVASLEGQLQTRPAAAQPVDNTAAVLAAPILIPVPIVEAAPSAGDIPSTEPPADTNIGGGPALPPEPQAEQDCGGTNANQPRCRPGRWNRPVLRRPINPVAPEPQANQQRSLEPR
jgi:hypothetical protein